MTKQNLNCEIDISEQNKQVTIKTDGKDHICAKIVGMTWLDNGSIKRIWLDRVVHPPGIFELGGWKVTGSFVTVLESPPITSIMH